MNHKPDLLIVGGGLGGTAAALAGCEMGLSVVLTEETDWLGGQLTSQAVPPDENLWIERGGCTRSYSELRRRIRDIYRRSFPLTTEARDAAALNPGGGHVSTLCALPEVGVMALQEMLAPWIAMGRLQVNYHLTPVQADVQAGIVRSVLFQRLTDGKQLEIGARYILDATDLGDVIALAGIPYVTGAESQVETGELHAHQGIHQPDNVQAFTWCLPLAYDPKVRELRDEYAIPKPEQYEFWKAYRPSLAPAWPGPLLDLCYSHPPTCQPIAPPIFSPEGEVEHWTLWSYRRIVSPRIFSNPAEWHEVSLINWPQNDYLEGNLIDALPDAREAALHGAKQLSLSLAYWLQNEAPRPDGGSGYAGLYLRPDITGTQDGLAKAPYIRESRRIQALATITEQQVGAEALGWRWPLHCTDSVGIGFYPIDLHPTTGGRNYLDVPSYPFQIPLGALIPREEANLLAGAKNIGTTHITSGCYRLHPVEWNIGESAATLAALCLKRDCTPHQVFGNEKLKGELQQALCQRGVPLHWPEPIKAEYDEAIRRHPLYPNY